MVDTQLITKVKSRLKDYNVVSIEPLPDLISYINQIQPSLSVIDSNVLYHFPELKILSNIIVFDSTEVNKDYTYTSIMLDTFISSGIKKNSKILAIGGGIVQDMVGYCCSIYARGISYHLVPTTLLAQCDSCIGGKTSINYKDKKNLIGTFFPPKEIIIHSGFVNTLTGYDYMSGLGEVFKFYCLQNKIDLFEQNIQDFIQRKNVLNLIQESLTYKSHIIEIDEFDEKERKYLNFGHTFGHAIESTSNFKIAHGSGVVIGILFAYYISLYLELVDEKRVKKVEENALKLISHIKIEAHWLDFDSLVSYILSDKKNTGKIVMILPQKETFVLRETHEFELRQWFDFAKQKIMEKINIVR